jgi:hypothetical protein
MNAMFSLKLFGVNRSRPPCDLLSSLHRLPREHPSVNFFSTLVLIEHPCYNLFVSTHTLREWCEIW